jgi:hypothetical protein
VALPHFTLTSSTHVPGNSYKKISLLRNWYRTQISDDDNNVVKSVVNNRIVAVYKWRKATHPAHNTKWKWRCLHFGANPGRSGSLKCQQMTVMLVVLLYTESGVYFLYKQIFRSISGDHEIRLKNTIRGNKKIYIFDQVKKGGKQIFVGVWNDTVRLSVDGIETSRVPKCVLACVWLATRATLLVGPSYTRLGTSPRSTITTDTRVCSGRRC